MSIFRELFVEVPTALLDAAITQAQRRVEPLRPGPIMLVIDAINKNSTIEQWLCSEHGLRSFHLARAAMTNDIEVTARLWCGHVVRCAPIDERRLHDSKSVAVALMDELRASLESARRCYCVQRDGSTP